MKHEYDPTQCLHDVSADRLTAAIAAYKANGAKKSAVCDVVDMMWDMIPPAKAKRGAVE